MQRKKLTLGILVDSVQVPVWMIKMIENIQQSNFAEIKLLVINSRPEDNTKPLPKMRHLLNKLYSQLIERHTFLPNAYAEQNCESLFKDIKTLTVSAVSKGKIDYLSSDDLELIGNYNLDVLIANVSRVLKGDVLNSAKFGVWSFHHADSVVNRGKQAGFWESMNNEPATGVMLQILTGEVAGGKILCNSFSCTDEMSIQDNKSGSAWKAISFMTRKLSELYDNGENAFFDKISANESLSFYSQNKPNDVSNVQLAGFILGKLAQKVKLIVNNKLFFNQWILMYRISDEFSSSLWKYKKIVPPKDSFWADPHIIYLNNTYYIFIEELPYETNKGHISVIEMDEKGNYGEPKRILEKPYHLSYPFVFEHDGEHYMIPESMDNNTIELYRCNKFPDKWEFVMNLMEQVKAVDATVFYHQNKWWMFANMVETEGASSWDELFLFSADTLLTQEWTAHPLNPIISDCHRSRPAGRIFIENGKIYRPSQNCSKRYGYGFNLNEIMLLDESHYSESLVSAVTPNWDKNILGTHTFSRENKLHVIDALLKRRK